MMRVLVLLACLAAGVAHAQALRIGSAYRPVTLDPHMTGYNETMSVLSHVFDRLIFQDETMALRPALAVSWRAVDPLTWEIVLREGVVFHDGHGFSAADVAGTIARIGRQPASAMGSVAMHTRQIASVEIVSPSVVRLHTSVPVAQMPLRLSEVLIGPADLPPADTLNQGQGVIGTGPYRFVGWRLGETVEFARNDHYWGEAPAWTHVTLRTIQADAARVAALLAGDVDVADYLRAQDVDVVRARGMKVAMSAAARSNFLGIDFAAEARPDVTDAAGMPLPRNPLRDPRVRRALSLAIDRQAIVARILGGFADPAAQPWPNSLEGSSKHLTPARPDPAAAKRLLAEAGYPNGFRLSFGGTIDRYPGDAETVQAVAQMWARIGVHATPTPAAWAMYTGQRAKHGYAVYYAGASGSDASQVATSLLHSADPAGGFGAQNYGLYKNATVDALIEQGLATFDPAAADAQIAQAFEAAMADVAIIPLYHYYNIWAIGPHVRAFAGHPRGWTTAMQATP